MPIAVVAAGISAVGAIGGGLIASSSAKSAANKAAAAQQASDAQAIAEQQRQYNQSRSDLMPWQTAGAQALGQQGNLLGLNGGEQQQSAIDALKSGPLYQSLFGNGRDALLANASATGGLRGGNTQGALANFGRDTLAGVIENQVSRLGGVAEQGQNAAARTGALGANSANAISSLLQSSGQAQAGAYLTNGAINASLANNIAGTIGGLANNKAVQGWVGKLF